jgi:hypothetical protein
MEAHEQVTNRERLFEATLLSGAIYYLLKSRGSFRALAKEVRTSFGSHDKMSIASLDSLKYLDASTYKSCRTA